jgi:diadenosine tetraphosphate (Ap4A) HIT family hydrolase
LRQNKVSTVIHGNVERARRGENANVIARVQSGWVVMGDDQVVRGYTLLLPDPVVASLNDLTGSHRAQYLSDMAALGDALLKVTKCRRINYEILGNLEPALHAHVIPRYLDEPESHRTKPIWFYDFKSAPKFDAVRDRAVMDAIREELKTRGVAR